MMELSSCCPGARVAHATARQAVAISELRRHQEVARQIRALAEMTLEDKRQTDNPPANWPDEPVNGRGSRA